MHENIRKGDIIMIDEIIRLLPSKSLRDKIRETGYAFSEEDLLYIIYAYAPSDEIRTEMLLRFAETSSPEIAEHARSFAEWDKAVFDTFRKNPNGEIYELCVFTPGGFEGNSYYCSSYPAVLERIDIFHKEYPYKISQVPGKAKYKITKLPVFNGRNTDVVYYYSIDLCYLDADKDPVYVCDDSIIYKNDRYCRIAPYYFHHTHFPCFLGYGDLVKYTDNNFFERYGVCLQKHQGPDCGIRVLSLDSNCAAFHSYERLIEDIDLILPPYVDAASTDELDGEKLEDYLKFKEYLKDHPYT